MNAIHARLIQATAFIGLCVGLAGCGGGNTGAKVELPPPQVTVAPPVEKTVTRYEFATGRTEAIESVEVRSRVTGYLKAIKFQPGAEVKKDQVLFEIDPDPFKADLEKAKASEEIAVADKSSAEAEVMRSNASVVFNKAEFGRQEEQFKKGGSSQKEYDKSKSDLDESTAALAASKAKVKLAVGKIADAKSDIDKATLNLGYCTIKAPVEGLIGDRLVTEGNLVTANSTLLTTIVSVDRMDVGFDVDEGTIERIQQAMRDKLIVMPKPGEVPAEGGLVIHGTDYPLKGKINFYDNQLDTKTGTMRMKARFDNPLPDTGKRMLSVGMYTRIRVPIGAPIKAMLVPESAFGSDQGIRYLFVIGPGNKAIRMDATIGVQDGEWRVVESVRVPGETPRPLTMQDRIIVGGMQRVRPGMTVDPKEKK
jgi:RND family efflux transporter MFP subunit